MSVGILVLIVLAAGAVGGAVNAVLTDNGFVLPRKESLDKGFVYRPGFLGNMLVGAVASLLSWVLYGPLAGFELGGPATQPHAFSMRLSTLGGALLVGVAGARWLSAEVDKTMLKAAATMASRKASDPASSERMAAASPSAALYMARQM